MAERYELNEQDLELVMGGAFRFKEDENGNMLCKVDNIGMYHATDNAKRKIAEYIATQEPETPQQVVDWAISQNYLWE